MEQPARAARVMRASVCRGAAQGNYSDLLVQLSNIYSHLRGDATGTKNEDSAQGFVRSTTKYWVRARAPRDRAPRSCPCAAAPQPACL